MSRVTCPLKGRNPLNKVTQGYRPSEGGIIFGKLRDGLNAGLLAAIFNRLPHGLRLT